MAATLLATLGQAATAAGLIFHDHLRGCVRRDRRSDSRRRLHVVWPKHSPKSGDLYRAGGSPCRALVSGQRENLMRPRVCPRHSDGTMREVPLATYPCVCNSGPWRALVVTAQATGVGTREIKHARLGPSGVGQSNISELWTSVGRQFVGQLRGVELSDNNRAILMLAGIRSTTDLTEIVAIGFTIEGHTYILWTSLSVARNSSSAAVIYGESLTLVA